MQYKGIKIYRWSPSGSGPAANITASFHALLRDGQLLSVDIQPPRRDEVALDIMRKKIDFYLDNWEELNIMGKLGSKNGRGTINDLIEKRV